VWRQRETQSSTLWVINKAHSRGERGLIPELRDIEAERGALQRAIAHAMPPVEEVPRHILMPRQWPQRASGLGQFCSVPNEMAQQS